MEGLGTRNTRLGRRNEGIFCAEDKCLWKKVSFRSTDVNQLFSFIERRRKRVLTF